MRSYLVVLVVLALSIFSLNGVWAGRYNMELTKWTMQTSAKVTQGGAEVSTSSFDDSSWYSVTAPATVMAGLVENKVYDDLFFSNNLQSVDTNQFNVPWWYRSHFTLSSSNGKTVRVIFEGLNYKADVWFNGKQIGSKTNVVGAFAYFEFDLSSMAVFDSGNNVLAVAITRPEDSISNSSSIDLSITFVDWAPLPPDGNMGLWRSVQLYATTAPLSINYPLVQTKLSNTNLAHLTVLAEVANWDNAPVQGVVSGTIGSISFTQTISLNANQVKNIIFTNDSFPQLNVNNPKLWYPYTMGTPNLYELQLQVSVSGAVSDSLSANIGIREITSELTSEGYRLYRINGERILIRGGGYSPDLFQRYTPDWQENHFKYTKDMNLNTIRLEGKFEDDHFFDLSDSYGILLMPGICCCDAWQHWSKWTTETYTIAKNSIDSQIKRLRIHPGILVFLYSSDELPPQKVEQLYLTSLKDNSWPNPSLSSASDAPSSISGPTGVKMSGPYSWVPPIYWLQDTSNYGGAYGFLTEGGPGENPLSLSSFPLTFKESEYWPINNVWNFHCGASFGQFGNLNFYTPALQARYGASNSAEEYIEKSQVMAYEGHKAMFEAYGRNKYTSTGVIQWMLNNAFPEMIWHLYDYYFNPSSTYFATKSACEPLHIQYSYTDKSIWVVNSMHFSAYPGPLTVRIGVYSIDSVSLYEHTLTLQSVGADATTKIFTLPAINNLSKTYFLRLSLTDSNNKNVSINTYWLSTSEDVLEWDNSNWFRTPCKSYADLTGLNSLPKVTLQVTSTNSDGQTLVNISNPSDKIAFFVHIAIQGDNGREVWPAFYDTNYFTLLPGESLNNIKVTYSYPDTVKAVVDCWNC